MDAGVADAAAAANGRGIARSAILAELGFKMLAIFVTWEFCASETLFLSLLSYLSSFAVLTSRLLLLNHLLKPLPFIFGYLPTFSMLLWWPGFEPCIFYAFSPLS